MSMIQHAGALFLITVVSLFPGLGPWLLQTPAEGQTIARTMSWPAASPASGGVHRLELSNINGSVRIVAEDRRDVAIVATRTVTRQGSAAAAARAVVDFRQDKDRLLICGDARRCGCHLESGRDDGWRADSAPVRVDFEVRVPRLVTLEVCAVNSGTVRVEGTEGAYTLRNVNGDLEMVDVRGAGQAHTVNGNLSASFAAVPVAAAGFKTVNGRVRVTFPDSLSADLRMTTLNGGLYTDFDSSPLPPRAATSERHGTGYRLRSDRSAAIRVGRGGPELTFESLNGDVQVRKRM